MKATRLRCVLFAAVAAIVSVTAFAADWVVDTSAKTLTLMDGETVVWKFNCSFSGEGGKEISFTKLVSGKGDLDLRGIPDDYKVVNLGNVFQNTGATLTSLIEPDTLTMLNTYEFFNDSAFVSFTGGGSVLKINQEAFWNCSGLRSSLSFPKCGICGSGVFKNCSKITGVSLPLLTKIGDGMFQGCSSCLTFDINWAEITYIGDGAFDSCAGLKGDMVLPKLTYLGSFRATKVTSVDAPEVETLGPYAFFQTSTLTNFTFGAKLKEVKSDRVFYDCKQIGGDREFPLMTYVPVQFLENTKITSVSFTNATEIRSGAFQGCSLLTNIVFNLSILVTVGKHAFVSCSGLKGDFRFPEATTIGGFKWASGITSVYAPKAKVLTEHGFYNMSALTNVVLGSNVETVDDDQTFTFSGKLTGDYDFSKVARFPASFMNGTKVTSIRLDSATTFGANAFNGTPLTNIVLGAATALPASLFNGAKPGCCVDFLADVPTFGSLTFPATTTTLYRFFVRDRKYLVAWQNACFALRGSDAYEPYRVGAPRRTIGVMYANSEQSAVAYVVDGTPSGIAIIVK